MDRIGWDPALEIGDETVDSQHRQLVEMLDHLIAAESQADARTAIPETLESLSAYVSTHFAAEKDIMLACGFPQVGIDAHLEEHRKLTERTRDFVLEYRRGEVESVVPLAEFLHAWLVDHVDRVDRELIEFVQGRAS